MLHSEIITVAGLASFALLLVSAGQFDRLRRGRESGRSSSAGAGIIGGFDQVFHPDGARAAEIQEVQRELPAEAALPGDRLQRDRPINLAIPRDPSSRFRSVTFESGSDQELG